MSTLVIKQRHMMQTRLMLIIWLKSRDLFWIELKLLDVPWHELIFISIKKSLWILWVSFCILYFCLQWNLSVNEARLLKSGLPKHFEDDFFNYCLTIPIMILVFFYQWVVRLGSISVERFKITSWSLPLETKSPHWLVIFYGFRSKI